MRCINFGLRNTWFLGDTPRRRIWRKPATSRHVSLVSQLPPPSLASKRGDGYSRESRNDDGDSGEREQ